MYPILLNTDILSYMFYCTNLNAQDLIHLSQVDKKLTALYTNNATLWQICAAKHSIGTNCDTAKKRKEFIFKIMLQKITQSPEINQLIIKKESIISVINQNGSQFPFEYKDRIYSIYKDNCLYLNNFDEKYWILEIKEKWRCNKQRIAIPLNNTLSNLVWINENIVVYSENNGCKYNKSIKMIDLNKIRYKTNIPNLMYHKTHPNFRKEIGNNFTRPKLIYQGTILDNINITFNSQGSFILKIRQENLCSATTQLTVDNSCSYITNMEKIIYNLGKIHENKKTQQILVLKKFLPSRALVPKKFICPATNTLIDPTKLDEKQQTETLEWLQNDVFEIHFNKLCWREKNSIYDCLAKLQNCHATYYKAGEDAFHDRNGRTSTMDEKIKALYLHLQKNRLEQSIPAPFEDAMEKIFNEFAPLPIPVKASVYSHLLNIKNLKNTDENKGQDIFYNRNGQTSTVVEKTRALQQCLLALQTKLVEMNQHLNF